MVAARSVVTNTKEATEMVNYRERKFRSVSTTCTEIQPRHHGKIAPP